MTERFRIALMANGNLYHVTKFFLHLSFSVNYFYTSTCSFRPVLSIRIVSKACFNLLIFC